LFLVGNCTWTCLSPLHLTISLSFHSPHWTDDIILTLKDVNDARRRNPCPQEPWTHDSVSTWPTERSVSTATCLGVDHLDDSDEDTDHMHSEIDDISPSGDDVNDTWLDGARRQHPEVNSLGKKIVLVLHWKHTSQKNLLTFGCWWDLVDPVPFGLWWEATGKRGWNKKEKCHVTA
jgi:hypothetical protein